MVAIVGAKEGGPVDVGAVAGGVTWEITKSWPLRVHRRRPIELLVAGVEAWGCGLCQGHLSAVAAAVVVAVADTVVGRARTIVVVVAAVVVVVAAAVASAVASDHVIYYVPELKTIRHIVARMAMVDTILCLVRCHIPICLLRRESKGIQGHEGCKDIFQRLGQRRILGSFGFIGLSGGIAILRRRNLGVLALILWRVLTLGRLLPIVTPWLLRLLGVWRPTYRALGVTYRAHLFIGLDPFGDWALRLLSVTGFRGLKHRVYRRVLELGLNETGSAV
ncbi:hypothetical protein Taro_055597 [Colocasia esculenta]|uniref:Uncharacterized protein n=1 Tax=Colocasia esculenta TaxID=4460 RepID=A0A843XUR1_COLES|nr:hypothetical protein [Colocasia esculenta]